MIFRNLLSMLALLSLVSCSGISLLSQPTSSDLYNDDFLEKVKVVKETYRKGQIEEALEGLHQIDDSTLLPTELAFKKNLIGVILFSKEHFEEAIDNFILALTTSRLDESLTSQIYLNLASGYYRLGLLEKSLASLNSGEVEKLNKAEQSKFHLLKIKLGTELGNEMVKLEALTYYLGDKQNLEDLKKDKYTEQLRASFSELGKTSKFRFLEDFEEKNFLCIFYLGYLELEQLYYRGEKDEAEELLDWVLETSKSYPEIVELAQAFAMRTKNYAKMDPSTIGIILPMSGDKQKFGKRVLLGIDSGIKELQKRKGLKSSPYVIQIRDSKGSGAVGAENVRKLIEEHHVAAIIGGLFPAEASKEYMEARKRGVLFISLSQIYIPKEQKDHLLLEIPGSVESQLNQLFSEKMLDQFGRKAAIVYPKNSWGDAYVDEFWRKAQISGVEVTGVLSYEKDKTDYRGTIKKLLGLQFVRERQEELDLLSEIHSLEKHTSARRIQTLKPQVDFDWVFVPALPKDALQIIPSFAYYDAFRLNIFGGPSWRSQALSRHSSKLGRLYFIGDDVLEQETEYVNNFIKRYNKKPRLIEMRGYDAFTILDFLLSRSNFTMRDELDISLRQQDMLNGLTGKWVLQDGIWIKEMAPLKLRHGKIEKIFETQEI